MSKDQLSDKSDEAHDEVRVKTDVGIQNLISHISEVDLESFTDLDEGSYVFSREKTQPYEVFKPKSSKADESHKEEQAPPLMVNRVANPRRQEEPLTDPVELTRRWLEQIQALPLEARWIHLPAHNQLSFDLLWYQGSLVFAPGRGNRLFLDFQFRRQAPTLTRRMRDMFALRPQQERTSCLFSHHELGELSKEERDAMASQLLRLIQQSATLYGPRRAQIELSSAQGIKLEDPISFEIEALLPPRKTAAASSLLNFYTLLEPYTHERWLFEYNAQLSWEHIVQGPTRFELARLHSLISLADHCTSAMRFSTDELKVWLGVEGQYILGVVYTPSSLVIFLAELPRFGFIHSLISALQDEVADG